MQMAQRGACSKVGRPSCPTHEVDEAQNGTVARTTNAHFDVPGVQHVRDIALQQISSKMVQRARCGACASVGVSSCPCPSSTGQPMTLGTIADYGELPSVHTIYASALQQMPSKIVQRSLQGGARSDIASPPSFPYRVPSPIQSCFARMLVGTPWKSMDSQWTAALPRVHGTRCIDDASSQSAHESPNNCLQTGASLPNGSREASRIIRME